MIRILREGYITNVGVACDACGKELPYNKWEHSNAHQRLIRVLEKTCYEHGWLVASRMLAKPGRFKSPWVDMHVCFTCVTGFCLMEGHLFECVFTENTGIAGDRTRMVKAESAELAMEAVKRDSPSARIRTCTGPWKWVGKQLGND